MDITSLVSELTAIGGPQAVLTEAADRAAYERGLGRFHESLAADPPEGFHVSVVRVL